MKYRCIEDICFGKNIVIDKNTLWDKKGITKDGHIRLESDSMWVEMTLSVFNKYFEKVKES